VFHNSLTVFYLSGAASCIYNFIKIIIKKIIAGLTHSALVGLRKQSVVDAERLLSFRMCNFMTKNNFEEEATFLKAVAGWHEASDGRGLTQLERCKANYIMLNYILDEWMPWHRNNYDFSSIDINR
jgi:hypothetical protein